MSGSHRHERQNEATERDEQLARLIQEQERQRAADQDFADISDVIDGLLTDEELRLARDHELAFHLATGHITDDADGLDGNINLERLAALTLADDQGSVKHAACTACAEEYAEDELATTSCNHLYCAPCLSTIFRQAMTDEAYFPPRCCQQAIPLAHAKHFLGPQLSEEFEVKSLELTTADRTYCHNTTCSTFIAPATIRDGVARCPTCGATTCSMCKAASHAGDCPQDVDLQQTLAEAARQGWRRCDCGQIVELNFGCNHMTCRCRREFCYVCGARWKTCRCAQWDEGRLYRQAEQVVNRQPALPRFEQALAEVFGHQLQRLQRVAQEQPVVQQPAILHEPQHHVEQPVQHQDLHELRHQQHQIHPPEAVQGPQARAVARQARVQEVAQQLRENHECTHPPRWRRFKGYHHCPVCGKQKKDTVGECKRCFLVACYHCRRHRL